MNTIRYLIFTTLLVVYANPSHSIGATEAGVLYGVFGTLVLQKIQNNSHPPEYNPNDSTSEYPPFRCNGDTVECSYQRGKWEREREEWLKAKDAAYQCGKFGKCD